MHPLDEDDELVAAEPAHHVPGADGGDHPPGHLDEHLVTAGVAVAVVDRLEAVQGLTDLAAPSASAGTAASARSVASCAS